MDVSSHFNANTPPPCASKNGPYDARDQSMTAQPEFELMYALQVLASKVPVKLDLGVV